MGFQWPCYMLEVFRVFDLPFLNTLILVLSRFRITFYHNMFLGGQSLIIVYLFSVGLGGYFLRLQILEYYNSRFMLFDSVFGGTFYMFTGFHGGHVFLGGRALMVVGGFLLLGVFNKR